VVLGILSPLVCILGYIPYIIAMSRNKIQPHPMSWLLWAILGFVSLVTYIGTGAHETIPLAILNFVGPVMIFFFTIKYWKGKFSRFDYVCLGFSLFSIAIYIIFHRAAIALSINLLGDFFAALPTIRKTYKDPSSESFLTWFCFGMGALLSLFAIRQFSYGIILLPLYLTSYELLMCALILRGRLKKH
jgi:hypothetical protein